MLKKFLSSLLLSFLAITLMANMKAFFELKEVDVVLHLASFAETNHHEAHDHDDDGAVEHENVSNVSSDHHTHKHRHAPNQPEHEHGHSDLSFAANSLQINFTQSQELASFRLAPVSHIKMVFDESFPSSQILSSLFRPPIV